MRAEKHSGTHRPVRLASSASRHYAIRLVGFPSVSADAAATGLMRWFDISRARALDFVHHAPLTVRSDLDEDTARRFAEVLLDVGARIEVVCAETGQQTRLPPPQGGGPARERGVLNLAARARRAVTGLHRLVTGGQRALPRLSGAHPSAGWARPGTGGFERGSPSTGDWASPSGIHWATEPVPLAGPKTDQGPDALPTHLELATMICPRCRTEQPRRATCRSCKPATNGLHRLPKAPACATSQTPADHAPKAESTCGAGGAGLDRGRPRCETCGWHNVRRRRTCVGCQNTVRLTTQIPASRHTVTIGSALIVCLISLVYLVSTHWGEPIMLVGIGALSTLGVVGMIGLLLRTAIYCVWCRQPASPDWLVADEHEALGQRRIAFTLAIALCAILSAGALYALAPWVADQRWAKLSTDISLADGWLHHDMGNESLAMTFPSDVVHFEHVLAARPSSHGELTLFGLRGDFYRAVANTWYLVVEYPSTLREAAPQTLRLSAVDIGSVALAVVHAEVVDAEPAAIGNWHGYSLNISHGDSLSGRALVYPTPAGFVVAGYLRGADSQFTADEAERFLASADWRSRLALADSSAH